MKKECTKCKIEKGLTAFGICRSNRDGLNHRCRTCFKAYRDSHKQEIKAYNKKYRDSHKELIRVYETVYRKTSSYKKSRKKSNSKSYFKYPNAHKSRKYYVNKMRGKRPPYSVCSNCTEVDNIEAHHHDYNKPMDVTFLCTPCHKDWHINNTPLNRETGIFTDGRK